MVNQLRVTAAETIAKLNDMPLPGAFGVPRVLCQMVWGLLGMLLVIQIANNVKIRKALCLVAGTGKQSRCMQ